MADSRFESWLKDLARPGGSDLYITVHAPPMWRGDDGFKSLQDDPLSAEDVDGIISSFLSDKQKAEFDETGEFNMALVMDGVGRFRLNLFRQRQLPGIVARIIRSEIPTIES